MSKMRCNSPIVVMARMASNAMPYRRSWAGPGTADQGEDGVALVAGEQTGGDVAQRQRGQQHGGRHGRPVRLAELVGAQRHHGHHQALAAQAHPVGGREHRRADRPGRSAHQAGAGLVEAQRNGDRNVDHHVEPQDLQRVERDAAGDVEGARADEDGDVRDQCRHLEAQVLSRLS